MQMTEWWSKIKKDEKERGWTKPNKSKVENLKFRFKTIDFELDKRKIELLGELTKEELVKSFKSVSHNYNVAPDSKFTSDLLIPIWF